MVLTFDALVGDPLGTAKAVAGWVGLDAGFYDAYGFPRENETYAPRSRLLQTVNVAVRRHLPGGRAYDAARTLYRRLNTRRPSGADAAEAASDRGV